MVLSPEDHKQLVKNQPRGPHGHFLSSKVQVLQEELADKKSTQNTVDVENGKDDESLIDIKVNNPLHKITQILESIKSHQSTSFNLKFSIPLIALPVFIVALLGVFQLGRAQVSCFPTFTSKIGTLKTIDVMSPKNSPNILSGFILFFPALPKILPANNLTKTTTTLLIQSSQDPISVIKPDNMNLINYEGQTVIVSGNYSECTNSITLDNQENITLLH